MALVNCPECKKGISDRAPSCPHCGYPGLFGLNSEAQPPPETSPQTSSVTPQNKSIVRSVLLAIGTIVVVILSAWLIVYIAFGKQAADTYIQRGMDLVAPVAVKADKVILNEILNVPSKQARLRNFYLPYDGDLHMEVSVVRGTHINVLLIHDSEEERYRNSHGSLKSGEYKHYSIYKADKAKTVMRSSRMAAGAYWVIIENPTWGILSESTFDVAVKLILKP